MKKIIPYFILPFLVYCSSKEQNLIRIIDESYFGMHGLKKMKEIKKLDENIYSLPVHYAVANKYTETREGVLYEIVRYIYKTNEGSYRMFYIIDFTNKVVVEKSSNASDFFIPIAKEVLGEQAVTSDLEGNGLMEIMNY